MLVVITFFAVFVIWIIWVATGAWSSRQNKSEVNIFGDILNTSQRANTEFNFVKEQINDSWQRLKSMTEQAKEQAELLDIMREKITEISTTTDSEATLVPTTTTSTIQTNN